MRTSVNLSAPGTTYTTASGISGSEIVGNYDSLGNSYAFLYNGNSYTTLDFPGANLTEANGISGNDIVGYYGIFNGAHSFHGFLFTGSSYITLDAPGAEYTWAYGISGNDIVGAYTSSNGEEYGFLATPVPEPTTLVFGEVGVAVLMTFGFRHQFTRSQEIDYAV